jgi:hypothetical protein
MLIYGRPVQNRKLARENISACVPAPDCHGRLLWSSGVILIPDCVPEVSSKLKVLNKKGWLT